MKEKIEKLVEGLTTMKQVEKVLQKNNINYRIDTETGREYDKYIIWVDLIKIAVAKTSYRCFENGKEVFKGKKIIRVMQYRKEPLISEKAYNSFIKLQGILY